MKPFARFMAIVLICAFALPLLISPVLAETVKNDPLKYYLNYDEKEKKVFFVVTNPSSNPVNLSFKSGKDFDLEIKQGNKTIWKHSAGRFYTLALRNETLAPGFAKFYESELPQLRAGKYEVLAYFEGGPSAGKVVASMRLQIGQPEKRALEYDLVHDEAANEMTLTVKNTTTRMLNLTFPSAKKFDLVVFNKAGQKVWQLSDGQFYTQALVREYFYPQETKSYKAKLPRLEPGEYHVVAYYHATGINDAVASAKLSVKQDKNLVSGLKFDAYYSGGSQPKITFAVRNLTGSPITVNFPTSQKFEVVIKGSRGFTWRYSAGKAYSPVATTETIRAGVNRFNYLYIPKLPAGKYTAEVYYLGLSSYRPAATTHFTVY